MTLNPAFMPERRKGKAHSTLLPVLGAAIALTALGCATDSALPPSPPALATAIEETVSAEPDSHQQIKNTCGDSIRYPVTDNCAVLCGKFAPVLRRKSDLIMAVWRECPNYQSLEDDRLNLQRYGVLNSAFGLRQIAEDTARTQREHDAGTPSMPAHPCSISKSTALACAERGADCAPAQNVDPWCNAYWSDPEIQRQASCSVSVLDSKPACLAALGSKAGGSASKKDPLAGCMQLISTKCDPPAKAFSQQSAKNFNHAVMDARECSGRSERSRAERRCFAASTHRPNRSRHRRICRPCPRIRTAFLLGQESVATRCRDRRGMFNQVELSGPPRDEQSQSQ